MLRPHRIPSGQAPTLAVLFLLASGAALGADSAAGDRPAPLSDLAEAREDASAQETRASAEDAARSTEARAARDGDVDAPEGGRDAEDPTRRSEAPNEAPRSSGGVPREDQTFEDRGLDLHEGPPRDPDTPQADPRSAADATREDQTSEDRGLGQHQAPARNENAPQADPPSFSGELHDPTEHREFEREDEDEDLSEVRIVLEGIEVVGASRTRPEVILRRLQLQPGDVVRALELEAGRLRLLATGYFRSVEFRLRRGTARGLAELIVEVAERNTMLIDEVYLGASPVSAVFGGLALAERNFLGRGVTVATGFVAGHRRRAFELAVFVPDVAMTPLQISASGVALEAEEIIDPLVPAERSPKLGYKRLGGTLGIGLRVGPSQRIALHYRLETIRAEQPLELDPLIRLRAPFVQIGDSLLSTAAVTYERDTRDDGFVPSRGGRVALTVELGSSVLGSQYEFSKYTAEWQQGFAVFANHRLVLSVVGGLIQGRPPFFDQFFLADHTYFALRRNALPRQARVNFSASNDYDDLLASAQASYHVPILRPAGGLYAAYLFLGAGAGATASLQELQEDPTGRGAGGQFPLSLDAGLKLDTWIGNFTLSLAYTLELVI